MTCRTARNHSFARSPDARIGTVDIPSSSGAVAGSVQPAEPAPIPPPRPFGGSAGDPSTLRDDATPRAAGSSEQGAVIDPSRLSDSLLETGAWDAPDQHCPRSPSRDRDGGLTMNAAVAFSLENLQTAPGPCQGLAQNLKVFRTRNVTPPNHRPKNYSGDGAVSHPAKDRTWRQPKLVPLNKSEVARHVAEALRQDFGQRAAKHKVIAEAAGAASENTAKAWTRQVSLPALEYFLELGRRSPALRAMTLRIWEMESEMDPEMQKAFTEFCQMMAKR